MKLSNQAMGALMMALQKALLEQSDIVPVLKGFNFIITENEELEVTNPPQFKLDHATPLVNYDVEAENNKTVGSD